MWSIPVYCVPDFLTQEQRDQRIEVYHKWLKRIKDEPDVMGHVITGDKSWICHFDPDTKQESMHYKSPQSPV